jgi:cell division septal protein FtsQ
LHKRSKFTFAIGATVLVFAAAAYLLAWSSVFSISKIAISGAPTESSKNIISKVANLQVGDQLARVEPRAISVRISSVDWVEDIEISRNWITGEVRLAVTPRTPTAFFNNQVLDASGKVFSLPGFKGGDLPRVSASNPELGVVAINLFQSLPQSIRDRVKNLAAYNESNFSLKYRWQEREIQILWGKNDQNELKAEVIAALLELPENKNIRRIDVSAPHAPIVK